jgi:hypothetical protein
MCNKIYMGAEKKVKSFFPFLLGTLVDHLAPILNQGCLMDIRICPVFVRHKEGGWNFTLCVFLS